MSNFYDEEAKKQRENRLNRMRREKEKQLAFRKRLKIVVCVLIATIAIGLLLLGIIKAVKLFSTGKSSKKTAEVKGSAAEEQGNFSAISLVPEIDDEERQNLLAKQEEENKERENPSIDLSEYSAHTTEKTKAFNEEVVSEYGVVIDIKSGEIIAEKGYRDRISPASMTKILTVLTAADYIEKLDDTIEMTAEITDYGYIYDCSSVGFEKGETVTVKDLLYGTILPSGADAAVGLATYVAGNQEAFVQLMNEKVQQLGLSESSHFTNCVGVYDENLYSTTYDMAIILEAAISNPLLRDVLSAHTYTTSMTEQHPEGITVSNWFLRRIEDKNTSGQVLCAKTGYVVQSKNCAASYQIYDDGREYICVTAGSTSSWRCIYDHVELYNQCN